MEDGSSQESEHVGLSSQSPTSKLEESQTRREPQSELMEDETLKEPITVAAIIYIQEVIRKTSDESQSLDYDFLENLINKGVGESSNSQESPEQITINTQVPAASTQLEVVVQEQSKKRSEAFKNA